MLTTRRSALLLTAIFGALGACSSSDDAGPNGPLDPGSSSTVGPDGGTSLIGDAAIDHATSDSSVTTGDGGVRNGDAANGSDSEAADGSTSTGCAPAPTSATTVSVTTTGATGDGSTDDTVAIQSAIDQVSGSGGTVLVPNGTYMINANRKQGAGLIISGALTLKLSSGATLKAIPNNVQDYAILQITGDNVNIVGGTVEGERAQHTGTGGEWGMGLNILGTKHLVVEGVTAKETWGDGFYVSNSSSDVTFCNVVATHNRRQGLSIISVDGMVVKNSTFNDTDGTAPQAGIDIEPNSGDTAKNIQITGSTANGNSGAGMMIYAGASNATVTSVTFDGNSIASNKDSGLVIYTASGNSIVNNTITNNTGDGITLENDSSGNSVSGNTVTGNSAHGIDDRSGQNTIGTNTVSGNGANP